LNNLSSLTASLFGIAAGILGLESYYGFIFYLVFSLITSGLIYIFRILPGVQLQEAREAAILAQRRERSGAGTVAKRSAGQVERKRGIEHGDGLGRYFRGGLELWTGGLIEGLTGFVLTWTLFYGLVRA
jgi:hypothetical protein